MQQSGTSGAPGVRAAPNRRSVCPVAGALDLVGDRWTLLVIRDLLAGKSRYSDLAASPERIATNTLANRLKRLEDAGIVESARYSAHPPRFEYYLTPAGRELGQAVEALAQWGLAHLPETRRMAG